MGFKQIHSEVVYHGRAFEVHRDQVELPDGKVTHLDVVSHSGAVTILPLDEQGRIWFVRQYRYPAGQELLELPAGTLEKDEPPEEAARREIREEIGMAAGKIEKLGEFFLAPGYSTEYMHVYLATDLHADPLSQDEDEFLSVEQIRLEEAMALAEMGRILDGKSLAALFLARARLGTLGQ